MGEKIALFKSPVVVGLAGVLPEGVNTLIWWFVGFQSKAGRLIKQCFEEYFKTYHVLSVKPFRSFATDALHRQHWAIINALAKENEKLRKITKISHRWEEFQKLKMWKQTLLIDKFYVKPICCYTVFQKNRKWDKLLMG